jgi:hypothetical protein
VLEQAQSDPEPLRHDIHANDQSQIIVGQVEVPCRRVEGEVDHSVLTFVDVQVATSPISVDVAPASAVMNAPLLVVVGGTVPCHVEYAVAMAVQ